MMAGGPQPRAAGLPHHLYPGLLLGLTVLAINMVGDGLRDALDPSSPGGYEPAISPLTAQPPAAPDGRDTFEVDDLCPGSKRGRHRAFGGRRLLVDPLRRETLGIVGESGCGKSITALSVLRLIPRRRGDRGRRDPLQRRGPAAARRRADARDPGPQDLDDLPGADDLAEPGVHGRRADRGDLRPAPEVDRRAAREPAVEMLHKVGSRSRRGPTSTRTSSPAACGSAR